MEKLSESLEDYLEAVVMLAGKDRQPVRSVDIANKLGVSKASVSNGMAALRERGYVAQAPYGNITLTEVGVEYGESVLKRHHFLTMFFTETLGIPADVAEEEACAMEHAISPESFEKWESFILSLGRDD